MAQKSQSEKERARSIILILQTATKGMIVPAATSIIKQYGREPFLVLVSCILSLRTKDTVSLPASQRLFARAQTPAELLNLSAKDIEKLIYPTGFYRQKTKQLHALCAILLEKYHGRVPKREKDLLALPGVGPKTTALVLSEGFGIPAICVDTHVHRISNRLGLVKTKNVTETEQQLKKLLPKEYWSEYNKLMVRWGQNICVPISPKCSICPLLPLCPQIGVTRHR
ncbi:MAG TPA: endonuclease III [Candidatus Babeliales bacterium]|nr:endonuclease III [Candidatus Babeliales bacterium]HLC06976.1 endonuclease III [Candidatus Babeliales bacterium]